MNTIDRFKEELKKHLKASDIYDEQYITGTEQWGTTETGQYGFKEVDWAAVNDEIDKFCEEFKRKNNANR